ncbi:MAG TPA: phosphoribosylglycinamide formyltransferase [Candidatus Limnocylindrales bacterium]|nr:phosphoribosylglycinamide formyltransferase [Candidatus Limnocylindrales bacterium]
MTLPIGVLVSGRGTNLQAILDACATGGIGARVVFIASNRENVPALIRAERAGVRRGTFTVAKYGTRAAAHGAIADNLAMAGARLVVLAGFDHILEPIFFVKLAGIPVINVHPALLPFFGGKGMHGDKVHDAVLRAKAKESGVTVHRVHPDTVDLGEVIVQRRVPVLESDDVPTLSARVLAVEHEAIVEAIRRFVPENAATR